MSLGLIGPYSKHEEDVWIVTAMAFVVLLMLALLIFFAVQVFFFTPASQKFVMTAAYGAMFCVAYGFITVFAMFIADLHIFLIRKGILRGYSC